MGESPLSDTAEKERESERERRSSHVDLPDSRVWGGWREGGAALRETVEIRRSPSPGRSGRTLHLATSPRRSAGRRETG